MNTNFIKILFTLAFAFLPVVSFAQADIAQRVNLLAQPLNPSPGQTVTLNVTSSEINTNLSTIEWFVDNKSIKKGVGQTSFTFTAGANGKEQIVRVRVTTQSGSVIEESKSFSPSDMDIIWEAENSSVPAFYKGKAMPIKQSQVKIVAVPNVKNQNGSIAKASDFSYTWKKDGQNEVGKSGFAKQSFSYINQILEETNRIDVSASNGAKTVSGSTIISYVLPEILFYETDVLTGVKYQNAIQNGFRPSSVQLSMVVEPYFLPKNWRSDTSTTFEWRLNNQKVNSKDRESLVVNTGNQTGSFTVNVAYNEVNKLFRNFSKTLTITPK